MNDQTHQAKVLHSNNHQPTPEAGTRHLIKRTCHFVSAHLPIKQTMNDVFGSKWKISSQYFSGAITLHDQLDNSFRVGEKCVAIYQDGQ